ncbi:MAG: TIGR03905 family TSCPD domain-containing protein [Bacteroidaceae bacterium]|nr:TIGR03905 family TSCPD domain-containing protein [Bacteroidaceae bacterium]
MAKTLYQTQGTCSKFIDVETDEQGRVSHCFFHGGCPGNTQGVAKLVIGKTPDEVIGLLDGIRCGNKPTSCPDQLCRALEQLKRENA